MTALPATFWSKVDLLGPIPNHRPALGPCWVWKNCVQSRGYGCFQIDGRRQSTHRLAYIDAKGPIPDGLTVDHLCMNKRCVNPEHLEAVTQAENNRRARVVAGYFIGGQCGFGHPLTTDSARQTKRGQLACKACDVKYRRNHYLKVAPNAVVSPAPFEVRDWARANGYEIGTAGRISKAIKDAYLSARFKRPNLAATA